MAKFYGLVGFVQTVEKTPDIWTEEKVSKPYKGELIRDQRRWDGSDRVNQDLNISNEISIIADKFAYDNLGAIKWVEVLGQKWKVNSVSIEYPRLKLSVGGIYNGE